MHFVSWNVNGLRACVRKGLLEFIKASTADCFAFQEIKISQKDIPDIASAFDDLGYSMHWYPARKNGYSGTAIFSRHKPIRIIYGIGEEAIDGEGRVLTLEFKKYFLINAYFPHTQRELARLDFKLRFNKKFEAFCKKLDAKKPIIITGDFNVAHTELDLANPKQNEQNAGFTPEERAWFDGFLRAGFIDTFRMFTKGNGHYTWWTYRMNARARNVGWRIDYFLVSERVKRKAKKSEILAHVMGSDHCPVALEIEI